ncbi:MAG: hypothetical protein JWQ25_2111 [Daejeonella sp.]|nr:hypothetical protein [Daejeonella sp.]
MRRILIVILFSITSSFVFSQEKLITADSKIQSVIVFLHGAQIERTAEAKIQSGTSTIIFKGLSPEIDEQSIQVKGIGNFTILSVNRQSNFLNGQKIDTKIALMQDSINELRDKLDIQQSNISILKKEEEILAANQVIGANNLDASKLKNLVNFQNDRLTTNKLKQLSSNRETKKLNDQIAKLEMQIQEVVGKSKTNTSDIVVKVSSKGIVNGDFKLTYLVKNATWFPSYDLRASDVTKPINLIYRANISQQCGEQWDNVKLILSSGDPSRGGETPSLRPYQIGFNVSNYSPAANITSVSGKITDAQDRSMLPGVTVRIKGTSIGTTSDASGNYSIQIPSPSSILEFSFLGYETQQSQVHASVSNVQLRPSVSSLNEVVVVGYGTDKRKDLTGSLEGRVSGVSIVPLEVQVHEGQTSVEFQVAQPYSISSDGKQLSVEIAEHKLAADYRYFAVPKLRQEAFLTASITGFSELNLLSGEVNLFFEGTYLGKTLINMENTNDTLLVSLGADKNVLVKRVQQKDKNEKVLTGSTNKATRAYIIEVLNRKSEPVNLVVEDQIPVSNTSDVVVTAQELSGAELEEATGMLKWNLLLTPNVKKAVNLKYQVKYPKNRYVNLE